MCFAFRTAHSFKGILGTLVLVLLLGACNSKKYLQPGQSFVKDNKLSLRSKHKIDDKSGLTEDLVSLYRQPQTRTVAGIPRHAFYYRYLEQLEKKPDKRKWSDEKIIRNRPVIYDSLKAEQTCADFVKFLAQRGYRSATANFHTITREKETNVYYEVDPGPRTYLDSYVVFAEDPALQVLVDSTREEERFVPGSPMDIDLYRAETGRLARLFQNAGYAQFDQSYFTPLEVDTAGNTVTARMRIRNPSDSTYHQRHLFGRVDIFPDYNITQSPILLDTTYQDITYHLPDTLHFTLKAEALDRNIHTRPGTWYRVDDVEQTLRSLGRIPLIRFVNPTVQLDTITGDTPRVNYNYLITRNKKIPISVNAELTYSNIASVLRRSLFGSSLSFNYRDVNVFGGAEVLGINLESGFEFDFFNRSETPRAGILNSANFGFNSSLSLPRFYDPLGLYRIFNKKGSETKYVLFSRKLNEWLENDAITQLKLGYSFVTIRDYYQYYNLVANLQYIVQPDPFRKIIIDRSGIDLFIPDAKPAYESILKDNPFLRESFGKQLFTGILFRGISIELNSRKKHRTGYFKLIQGFELSGLEVFGLNSFVNALAHETKAFAFGNPGADLAKQVTFSHFAKAEIDIRYYRDIGRSSQFAARINTGIATPYGPYTQQVPYIKQFYVGGPLSNRAWQIRELGPGSYQDTSEINPNVPFFQTGDLKFDMSLELRFPLFWYFKGALFIDAANIWTLRPTERYGSNLKSPFAELGIGFGYGVRMDLTYFILRADFGYRLHNPYPIDGSRWLIDRLRRFPGGGEVQIAVGMPF